MNKVNIKSKEDKKDENIDITTETEEKTTTTQETVEDTVNESTETSEEETEEKTNCEYKEYGNENAEEANSIEKMFNDVVTTLKSRQSEWNKTLEEYKANKPAVDLLEYEQDLVIKLDVPKVSKDDISIKMSTDSIEIEIDFPDYLEDEEDVKVLRRERCFGKTKNIIPLPVEVDMKEVKASFEDNELTITLPKIKGKKVDVEIL
ncbi:Hsp20/alpha crystallin family protein [Methanosphaera sp. ISO3-F5]|uniref:Hsp20/alpha crystallin family protein n=1 Tax=Methanosphaera sp. ISO3-F5 TaxID=1452353 RepID=UPI002B257250|nr:Hsp20/alpha crystallin family protein [Methanosphaera sp. ISO3-F5]WQH63237.1 Hsp20/alpha crystallin family protein [Methanosphaera sp. ISO3-F5]